MLTPSGRFETNTKVCLSFSAFHPELWQPAWGIRLILEALISFLPTPADGAIGALDWSPAERKKLAEKSVHYECHHCGKAAALLPKKKASGAEKPSRFKKEIEELQRMQLMQHTKEEEDKKDKGEEEEDKKVSAEVSDAEASSDIQTKDESVVNEPPCEMSEEDPLLVQERSSSSSPQPKDDLEPGGQSPSTSMEDPLLRQVEEMVTTAGGAADTTTDQVTGTDDFQLTDSWMMDPILQGIIGILSIIAFLLLRKIQGLLEDLQALEEE
jgi:ubiquitin-conjugating enzyme E2 J1